MWAPVCKSGVNSKPPPSSFRKVQPPRCLHIDIVVTPQQLGDIISKMRSLWMGKDVIGTTAHLLAFARKNWVQVQVLRVKVTLFEDIYTVNQWDAIAQQPRLTFPDRSIFWLASADFLEPTCLISRRILRDNSLLPKNSTGITMDSWLNCHSTWRSNYTRI